MFRRFNVILNYIIGSFVGAFIGNSIYRYFHYTRNPNLYEMQSEPWYICIVVNGLVVIFIVFVSIIAKLLIKKKIQKE
jgi:membrane protein DedA with SNARE-associated domain